MPERPVETTESKEREEVDGLLPDEAAVRAEQECRALVPVGQRRSWTDTGPRLLAAASYFAWLGYVLAPAPLLLLGSRRIRQSTGAVYHIYAATAWSVVIASLRVLLVGGSFWMGITSGELAEDVANALSLAHIVVLLSVALLLSTLYAIEALLGREATIPWISPWARGHARSLLECPDADTE